MFSLLKGIDIALFLCCILLFILIGILSTKGKRTAVSYFMADRDLRWWSVAGSIYGTNVSLAQIIGMLGIGYSIGFAQSHYELLAIPAILLLCHVFIPAYRKKESFTLSAFLGERYNESARSLYTIIMVSIIMILLVGGLYIGSRQLVIILSDTWMAPTYVQGVAMIAFIACILVFYGGMDAVVWAENLITLLMVVSVVTVGFCTLYQPEIGGFTGLLELDASSKGLNKMKLYLPSDHPDLPWTGVFSGLLVLQGFFWTTNQFEVQRVLAARSERDAQLGAIAAGFLKLTIPFFSISAGVAASYLFKYKYNLYDVKPDDAFIYLLKNVVPTGYGLLGLIFAGFLGAIFSSIYSMLNSLSTISAMDIYKRHIDRNADDRKLVLIGKISVVTACILGSILAWWSFSPTSDGNFFLTLSKNTSYLKPGIVSAFFLSVIWKRMHPHSATVAILAAPLLSLAIELIYDNWLSLYPSWRSLFGSELNFMHRVFIVFILCAMIQLIMTRGATQNIREVAIEAMVVEIRLPRLKYFIFTQCGFFLLVNYLFIPARHVSLAAGLVAWILFIDFRTPFKFVHFWGALLIALMVFTLYFFA